MPENRNGQAREDVDWEDVEVVCGNVRLVLGWIGEGRVGDYDPEDPEDTPLCRFSVYGVPGGSPALEPGYKSEPWAPFRDASYCTRIPGTLPLGHLRAVAEGLLGEVLEPASSGHSIKKLCERLSWVLPEDFPPLPAEVSLD